MKYLLPILLVFCFCSCQRHSDNWEKICDIENYIESRPDSALIVLEAIDIETLSSDEERAKYALYMSMALDKNYIDKTDFEVLQPAIDYYENHGSATDKLRTLYYQGRVYQNIDDNETAMAYYIRAAEIGEIATDNNTLARVYYAQGYIYRTLYDYKGMIDSTQKAASLYKLGNNHSMYLNCMVRIINAYTALSEYKLAKQHIDQCFDILPLADANSVSYFYSTYLSNLSKQNPDVKDFDSALTNYISNSTNIDYLVVSNALLNMGKLADASKAIHLVNTFGSIEQELKYYALLSEINRQQKKYELALDSYMKYIKLADSVDVVVYKRASDYMEERHSLELRSLKEESRKKHIIYIFSIVLSILTLIAIWISSRLRLSKMGKILAEKEVERYKILYAQMEEERDNLNILLSHTEELDTKALNAVARRLELLNKFFTAYITDNSDIDRKASKEMEELLEDKEKFMDSNRLAYAGSHPKFIKYLEDKGLTEWEINYCCLYALGLKGKEVGAYIKMRSHYNNSSEVREKLGISEHDTNLGIYIRKLVKSLSE